MGDIYISQVIRYGHHSVCVAGTDGDYRYMIACPNGKAFLGLGFTRVITAHVSAMHVALVLESENKKKP